MSPAHVGLVKNIKNAVGPYKENTKYPNKTINPITATKFDLDLKKFLTKILTVFSFILSVFKSSNWLTNPLDLPIVKNLFFL